MIFGASRYIPLLEPFAIHRQELFDSFVLVT
jgi:hypothetical protein